MSVSYVVQEDPTATTTRGVGAVLDRLLEIWPTPDMGADVDETPWASDPERQADGSVAFDVSVTALEQVLPLLYEVAREHGCRVFDPQAGRYLSD
jgi:hypothetical protein